MSSLLMIYESVIPTVSMTDKTQKRFSEIYGCDYSCKDIRDIKEQDIIESDIIVCVRGESPLTAGILEYAGKLNKFRVFMLDDDLLNLPKDSFRYPRRKIWLKKCLENSDVMLTSSQLIADDYREFMTTKRAYVIHTDINESAINPIQAPVDGVTRIVYAAGEKHIVFFDKFIRPVMKSLVDKYEDSIAFYFIGVSPTFDDPDILKHVTVVPSMPYEQYVAYMRDHRFDIGLAPLETNSFTARKYFNKYLEYAKDGICGLYSNCMPYQLVVKDGENGYLVGDNPSCWLDKISYVIDHPEERIACIEASQKYLREHHAPEKIYAKLKEDIPELVNHITDHRVGEGKISNRLKHKIFRIRERTYLTTYSLTHYGLSSTIARIKRKMK